MGWRLTLAWLVAVIVKVASSQWALVIELFEFRNPYNLEIDQTPPPLINYCCCEMDQTCRLNISVLQLRNCAQSCDVFFTVTVHGSDLRDDMTISTMSEVLENTNSDSSYGYIFTFNLDMIPIDLYFILEMRELSSSETSSRLIDSFLVGVNSSYPSNPLFLDGKYGVATALLGYQLWCSNLSTCDSSSSFSPPQPTDSAISTSTDTETSDANLLEEQLADAQDMQTLWMIIAILFLTMTVLLLGVSSVLACLLYKKVRSSMSSLMESRLSKEVNINPTNQDSVRPKVDIVSNEVYTSIVNDLYGNEDEPPVRTIPHEEEREKGTRIEPASLHTYEDVGDVRQDKRRSYD